MYYQVKYIFFLFLKYANIDHFRFFPGKNAQPSQASDFKTAPLLPLQNEALAMAFGLCWLNYLLDGPTTNFSDFMDSLRGCPFWPPHWQELCHQIHVHVINFGNNNSQKKLKGAILQWITEFPNSANALKSLTGINVQTAVSSAFWRSISASLMASGSSRIEWESRSS